MRAALGRRQSDALSVGCVKAMHDSLAKSTNETVIEQATPMESSKSNKTTLARAIPTNTKPSPQRVKRLPIVQRAEKQNKKLKNLESIYTLVVGATTACRCSATKEMNRAMDNTALQTLLHQASVNPAQLPALRQALRAAMVICLGGHVFDEQTRPWTHLDGVEYQGHVVLPCFLSEDRLVPAGIDTEQQNCLVMSFPDFVQAAMGYDAPIVIDLASAHEFIVLPPQFPDFIGDVAIQGH